MDAKQLKNILEAGLLVAGRALSIAQLEGLFEHEEDKPERNQIREALESLKEDYTGRGIELIEVASGFRLQSHESVADWVANLFQEKTPRYSRALLETLVLIAYRQPITRAEIEEVRGVAVSSNIVKTLQERQWVKILGHKEVPGRPALLGTTKDFLDYFNLKKLDDLPTLSELKDLDQFDELLAGEVGEVDEQGDAANDAGEGQDGSVEAANDASDENDSGDENAASADGSDDSHNDNAAGNDGAEDDAAHMQSDSDDELSAEDDSDERVDSELDASSDADENVEADENSGDDSHDGEDVDDDIEAAQQELDSEEQVDSAADLEAGSVEADGTEDDDDPKEHNETLSGPELELLRVISDFSDEHQQEIDARDQMESRILSDDDADNDNSDIDVADLSQRISDEHNGELPESGDTLH